MKKILIISFMMVLITGSGAWAALYTGSMNANNSGIIATGNVWEAKSGTKLDWSVDKVGDNWVYTYTFATAATKDIKTFDLQVASDFTMNDLVGWAVLAGFSSNVTGPPSVKPAITENISTQTLTFLNGLQWSINATNDYKFGLQITSTRAPMWGDFFVHGATTGGADCSARNSDFNNTDVLPVLVAGQTYTGVGVLMPKGAAAPVPVPPAAFLFGSGVSGMFLFRRRRPSA